jgi:hypothetical protein
MQGSELETRLNLYGEIRNESGYTSAQGYIMLNEGYEQLCSQFWARNFYWSVVSDSITVLQTTREYDINAAVKLHYLERDEDKRRIDIVQTEKAVGDYYEDAHKVRWDAANNKIIYLQDPVETGAHTYYYTEAIETISALTVPKHVPVSHHRLIPIAAVVTLKLVETDKYLQHWNQQLQQGIAECIAMHAKVSRGPEYVSIDEPFD